MKKLKIKKCLVLAAGRYDYMGKDYTDLGQMIENHLMIIIFSGRHNIPDRYDLSLALAGGGQRVCMIYVAQISWVGFKYYT